MKRLPRRRRKDSPRIEAARIRAGEQIAAEAKAAGKADPDGGPVPPEWFKCRGNQWSARPRATGNGGRP